MSPAAGGGGGWSVWRSGKGGELEEKEGSRDVGCAFDVNSKFGRLTCSHAQHIYSLFLPKIYRPTLSPPMRFKWGSKVDRCFSFIAYV